MKDYIDLADCGQCSTIEEDAEIRQFEADAEAEKKTEPPQPEPDPDRLGKAEAAVEKARAKGYEAEVQVHRYAKKSEPPPGQAAEIENEVRIEVRLWAALGRYALYDSPDVHEDFWDEAKPIRTEAQRRAIDEAERRGETLRPWEIDVVEYDAYNEYCANHEGLQRDLRALRELLDKIGDDLGGVYLVRTDADDPDLLRIETAIASYIPRILITLEDVEALPLLEELTLYTAEQIENGLLAAGIGYWAGMSVGRPPRVRFVLPWLPEGGVVCLYGREQVGKTAWLIDELMAAACLHEAVVVYFAIDGKADAGLRVAAAYEKHGWGMPSLFIASRETDLDLGNAGSGWQTLEREVEDAVKRCEHLVPLAGDLPVVVVVETLSTALNGADENGQGTARFLAGANRFVGAGDRRSFLFTHHPDGQNTKPRGFTAIKGNSDLVLKAHGRPDGSVTVTADKFRMGAKGKVFATFRVVPTEDGSTVTVEPVEKTEQPTPPKELEGAERDAWLALEAAGGFDGLYEDEVNEILARVVYEKNAKPSTLRMRRKRLRDALMAKGVLTERDGRLFLVEE